MFRPRERMALARVGREKPRGVGSIQSMSACACGVESQYAPSGARRRRAGELTRLHRQKESDAQSGQFRGEVFGELVGGGEEGEMVL